MKRILTALLAASALLLAACGTTKAESPLGKAADRVIDEIVGDSYAPVAPLAAKSGFEKT